MHSRKQLAQVIDQILTTEENKTVDLEETTVSDYQKLNDKCDTVITKIKSRKNKKNCRIIGE